MNNLYKITNYTNSDGSCTADYVVETISPEEYDRLVEHSILVLEKELHDRLFTGDISNEEETAIRELIASFEASLDSNKPKKEYTKDENSFYLEHCMILKKEISQENKKPVKHHNKVTEFKAKWRKHLPLKDFVRCFKFPQNSKADWEKIL